MEEQPGIYILTDRPRGSLYVGVTPNLQACLWRLRRGIGGGIVSLKGLRRLVYLEAFDNLVDAMERQRQLRSLSHTSKVQLVHRRNPRWHDLYPALVVRGAAVVGFFSNDV